MIRIALPLRLFTLLTLTLLVPLAGAQEAALTKRATELRQSPAATAPALAALPAQTPLTRLAERQGPWVQVRTAAGATGWVHLFDVAPAAGGGARVGSDGSANPLRGVAGLFGGGSTTTSTSASGIRGLGAEDLARATPNPAAVGQMETLRQSESDARAFAGGAALRPVAVDPLPAPARVLSPSGPGGDPSNPQQ
ncbi:SH3 domain-containing protein [Caenimonas sedimenti]|uniref:SH3 domain-containing protein n=1 Tax=Caenimonas sedimenti TaxID=2596921 RepID=A0A562ZUS9_9BURK|nr:SH3 domain-containing protein [Caenimonas sedimenti]TWO72350.1 SH3 domain-containing protein [Caenimonas sedimenti]